MEYGSQEFTAALARHGNGPPMVCVSYGFLERDHAAIPWRQQGKPIVV